MTLRSILGSSLLATMILIGTSTSLAYANPEHCGVPGAIAASYAQQPGPNAGSNDPNYWNGTPNAPGQEFNSTCGGQP